MKSIKINSRYYPIFTEMSGSDLLYLLKRLGISQRTYGLQVVPPLNTASGINNYSTTKKLPMRLIWPLLNMYDQNLLISLLEQYPNRR
jgi:hypothetical protein